MGSAMAETPEFIMCAFVASISSFVPLPSDILKPIYLAAMAQPDWQRVLKIAGDAIEISPSERESWLDCACGGDADLRVEVQSLLRASDEEDGFLEHEIGNWAEAVGAPNAPPPRIGPYRIVSEIG